MITASKVFKTAITILMITVLFRTASNQTKLYIDYSIRCYLLNIEALTGEKHETYANVSPHFLYISCFLSALKQIRAQSKLLYLFYNKKSFKFRMHYFQFSKHTLFPKWAKVSSIMLNHQSSQSAIVYRLK